MRFMIIRRSDQYMEAGALPDKKLMANVGRYYQDMRDAGILLGGEWLQPSQKGVRILASEGKKTIVDGPFTELKELIAGYTVIDVPTIEDAIAWAQRCPTMTGDFNTQMEVRQVYEAADFPRELAPELTLHASERISRDAAKLLKLEPVSSR
jgi:hypothetical protein